MRILFAGKQHDDPGGIQASTDQLARRLVGLGHSIAVLAHVAFDLPPRPGVRRGAIQRDGHRGYESYALDLLPPGVGLELVAQRFRPDVVVVNAGGSWWHDWTRALVGAVPDRTQLAMYVRDAEAVPLLGEFGDRLDLVLANAQRHGRAIRDLGCEAVVVPSVIEPDVYRVEPTGRAVLFINPVAAKGADTAFALAGSRPDIPFHFRESWHLPRHVARAVEEQAARLSNVRFLRSTADPRECYGHARVLLVPYADQNRPRVVPEAQVSGIPVLARDDPALREAVGPGGLLVPAAAPIDVWAGALDVLWNDPAAHARYSNAARAHSRRDEMDPAAITAAFVAAVERIRGRPVIRFRRGAGSPTASVIVPVRNVAATVEQQLAALAGQTFTGSWEVVVVDNGSTDGTQARVERWRTRLPGLRLVDASGRRGVAHARNAGMRAARGELLLICDGDDLVAHEWLERLGAALDDHPIVTGLIDIVALNREELYGWTGDTAMAAAPVGYGHLPYAPGGNIGMWRDVALTLGGFDERLRRAEDIDFSWRAAELGIHVHFEPRAVLYRRLRPTPWAAFRGGLAGGVAEPRLYRRHADRGMTRAPWEEVRPQYRWLVERVPDVIRGRADRHQWAHHAGKRVGRLLGSAINRTAYL